jgi:hypothetical protein
MGHTDVRLSRSSNRITDSERCGCGLQHCRLRRGDCVQPACWRNGLHHYDGDLWPRPLVLRSVIFPSHLDVITGPLAVAEQAPPGEWPASDRLAAGQALSRTCCAPSGPTWPTSATAHPAPPGQPGPAQPQSSVLCICFVQLTRPFPGAWHGLPVVLQWVPFPQGPGLVGVANMKRRRRHSHFRRLEWGPAGCAGLNEMVMVAGVARTRAYML